MLLTKSSIMSKTLQLKPAAALRMPLFPEKYFPNEFFPEMKYWFYRAIFYVHIQYEAIVSLNQ